MCFVSNHLSSLILILVLYILSSWMTNCSDSFLFRSSVADVQPRRRLVQFGKDWNR